MKKKFLVAAFVGVVVVFVAVLFLKKNEVNNETPPATEVKRLKRYVAAEGKVETLPGLDVEVGSEIGGVIGSFSVREGDMVAKGALIAELRGGDIAARLNEAESALKRAVSELELAQTRLGRLSALYNGGFISQSELDDAERTFNVTKARLGEAEAGADYYKRLLEKTKIRSPIAGKVIHKYLEEGESVGTDTPLVAVADLSSVRINAEVDETDIGRVHVGGTAEVTSDAYPGEVFSGRVVEISDYVGVRSVKPNNPAKNVDMKVVEVRVGLEGRTPLKLGMTVDVKIMPE